MTNSPGKQKLLLVLFIAFVLATSVFVFTNFKIDRELNISTQNSSFSKGYIEARNLFKNRVQRRIVLMISTDSWENTLDSANDIKKQLNDSLEFQNADAELPKKFADYLLNNKQYLLTKEQVNSFNKENSSHIVSQAKVAYFSPIAPKFNLKSDPLNLLTPYFVQSPLSIKEGFLTTEINETESILLISSIRKNQNALATTKKLNALIDDHKKEKGVEIYRMGAPFYINYSIESAFSEISLFGTASLIGVSFLFLFFFKSLAALGFAVLIVCLSYLVGLLSVHISFGTIHIFTLLLGTSIIGLSIDYLIHFLAHNKPLRPLLLSFISTLIGYTGFLVTGFEALQQLTVFVLGGLSTTLLTVYLLGPNIKNRYIIKPAKTPLAITEFWNRFSRRSKTSILCLSAMLIFSISLFAVYDDDVRMLQAQPKDLKLEEQLVRKHLGTPYSPAFAITSGKDLQEMLRSQESLLKTYDGRGHKLQNLAKWIPSFKNQKESYLAYKMAPDLAYKLYSELGFNKKNLSNWTKTLDETFTPILFDEGFRFTQLMGLDFLFLGQIDGEFYSATLTSQQDNLAHPFYSPLKETSSFLGTTRKKLVIGFLVSIMALLILMSFKSGLWASSFLLVPPLVCSVGAATVSALLLGPANIFHILGALLVFYLSLDYSIFYQDKDCGTQETSRSVLVSCLSTCLTFGIMAFSETNAVASFGLAVATGMALSLFFTPLSRLGDNNA